MACTIKKYKTTSEGLLELEGVQVILNDKEKNKLRKEQRLRDKENRKTRKIIKALEQDEKHDKKKQRVLLQREKDKRRTEKNLPVLFKSLKIKKPVIFKCFHCKGTGKARYSKTFTLSDPTCKVCSGTGKINK